MAEKKANYDLIIGRHCLVKLPYFLPGAVQEALSYGANALMIYVGAPQNTIRRPSVELRITEFHQTLTKHKLDINNVIVHGPYVVNLANTLNPKIFHQSVDFLKKEIKRIEEVGLKTIVIHPGSALTAQREVGIAQLIKGLNLVLAASLRVRIALETMCQRGNEIGGAFDQLAYIIRHVEHQERVGVCWDTCHLYAAGYDIKNNLEKVIQEFETKIGLDKLWVIHVNDSLHELGKRIDRHENIGYGKIGLEALKKIVWHPKLSGIPKLLETPRRNNFQQEIRLLKEK